MRVSAAKLTLALVHLALAQSPALAGGGAAVPCEQEPCPTSDAGATRVPWTALQLSLWSPVQLFSPQREVRGLRLNLGRAENEAVFGLDVGLGNQSGRSVGMAVGVLWNFTKRDFTGLQVGAVNFSDSSIAVTRGVRLGLLNVDGGLQGLSVALLNLNFSALGSPFLRGVQVGALNGTHHAVGLQVGGWSSTSTLLGAQLGLVNQSGAVRGLQLGLVNLGEDCVGLQVGVVNRCHTLRGVQLGLINLVRDGAIPFLPVVNAGL